MQEEYEEAMALMEEAHEMAQRVYPPNWFAKVREAHASPRKHSLCGWNDRASLFVRVCVAVVVVQTQNLTLLLELHRRMGTKGSAR